MKRSKNSQIPKILNLFGIFGIFLILGVVSAFLYSPVFKTSASESDSLELGATIAPVASVSLDTNSLEFEFTPTSSGVFDSKPVTATAKTNSQNGYEMYFSSVDSYTDMENTNLPSNYTSSSPDYSTVISSDFSGTVTSTTMENNKWGYSLDTTSSIDDKLFLSIPIKDNQLTLKNLDHLPETEAEKTATVNIGIKVDSTLASGTYTKDLIFSVLAHEVAINENKLVLATSMQDTNLATYCANSYTPTSAATVTTTSKLFNGDLVPEAVLKDTRDNNEYTIRKLADGKCWMTENLRIIGKTLTSEDSDVASSYTLPTSISSWTSTYDNPMVYDTNNSSYGVYYNYAAASAGTITGSRNTTEATHSVCTLGWKMPAQSEYADLLSAYNVTNDAAGSTIMRSSPLNFVYSGNYDANGTNVSHQGSSGNWWSSTVGSTAGRYRVYVNSRNARDTVDGNRGHGFSIRCVAR